MCFSKLVIFCFERFFIFFVGILIIKYEGGIFLVIIDLVLIILFVLIWVIINLKIIRLKKVMYVYGKW